jgi:hypothetical protein
MSLSAPHATALRRVLAAKAGRVELPVNEEEIVPLVELLALERGTILAPFMLHAGGILCINHKETGCPFHLTQEKTARGTVVIAHGSKEHNHPPPTAQDVEDSRAFFLGHPNAMHAHALINAPDYAALIGDIRARLEVLVDNMSEQTRLTQVFSDLKV